MSPRTKSIARVASATVSPDHHARSCVVAGPWLATYRRASCASASSRESEWSRGYPLVEQHDGLLLSLPRAETDDPALGQAADEVRSPPAGRRDPRPIPGTVQRVPREPPPAFERATRHLTRTPHRPRIETEVLRQSRGACRHDPRRQQRQHPAHVRRGDEVQRAAHGPRPHEVAPRDRLLDGSFGGAAGAQAHRPERTEVVLRLHGAEPADYVSPGR